MEHSDGTAGPVSLNGLPSAHCSGQVLFVGAFSYKLVQYHDDRDT